jgi:hypothetical protein
MKVDVALHYKPTEDSEIIFNSKIGQGNTMLHANNRNNLKNFGLQQHKIEYNNRNLNLRAYTSIENSGNTTDMSALGAVMVLAQPGGAGAWYQGYFGSYFGLDGIFSQISANPVTALNAIIGSASAGQSFSDLVPNDLPSHAAARKAADQNLLKPGSTAWNKAMERAGRTGINLLGGGAGILDTSKSNSFEVNYNLQDLVSIADVIIGGSFREYILRSNGTLFTDYTAPIAYDDVGIYAQAKKDLFGGALKLTGSMRYDKSEFFDGHITPRIGGILFLNENQNLRFSYQTGFQNPSAQDQYIGLDITTAILMGMSSDNIDRFQMDVRGVSDNTQVYNLTGNYIVNNSFTLASVQAGAPVLATGLKPVESMYVKSYDFGYRINGKKTAFDINAYLTEWDNFISATNYITPMYQAPGFGGLLALARGDFRVLNLRSNTDEIVRTYGVSLGFETAMFKIYDVNITAGYNKMKFDNPDSDYEAGFNTPQTRVKVSLGSTKLAKNFSFNVSAKYHDKFMYEQSGFMDQMIPYNTTFDASMNFMLPQINGKVKVGGVNLGGDEYQMIPGSGFIGSQYYVSFTLNP